MTLQICKVRSDYACAWSSLVMQFVGSLALMPSMPHSGMMCVADVLMLLCLIACMILKAITVAILRDRLNEEP